MFYINFTRKANLPTIDRIGTSINYSQRVQDITTHVNLQP